MRASGAVAACLFGLILVMKLAGSSASAGPSPPKRVGNLADLLMQMQLRSKQQQQGLNGSRRDGSSANNVVYDQIVVGAGIVGLWLAKELGKSGQKVLLLEQFPRGHVRGGSAGSSRAIELTYPIVGAAPVLKSAIQMYEDLQTETGVEVLKDTKILLLTEENCESTPIPKVKSTVEKFSGKTLLHMNSEQLMAEFPGFSFTPDSNALYDNVTAKEFLASKAIYALWTVLDANKGVKTVEACPVTTVKTETPSSNVRQSANGGGDLLRVACRTGDRSFLGKTVILATGPWTQGIEVFGKSGRVQMPEVVPMLNAQFYFKVKKGAVCADVGFMDWQWQISKEMLAWGRPSYNTQTDQDYLIGVEEKVEVGSPWEMESPAQFRKTLDKAREYVRKRMPCLDDNPTFIEKAMLYRTSAQKRGVRPLDGIDNVYLAIQGNTFGGSPISAKGFAASLLKSSKKP